MNVEFLPAALSCTFPPFFSLSSVTKSIYLELWNFNMQDDMIPNGFLKNTLKKANISASTF